MKIITKACAVTIHYKVELFCKIEHQDKLTRRIIIE